MQVSEIKKKKKVLLISLVGQMTQITLLSHPTCKPDKITAAEQLEK